MPMGDDAHRRQRPSTPTPSAIFAVIPFDTRVTGLTGTDTVTLQVSAPRLRTFEVHHRSEPDEPGPESGRLIVRANRGLKRKNDRRRVVRHGASRPAVP